MGHRDLTAGRASSSEAPHLLLPAGCASAGNDLPRTGNLTGNHTLAEAEALCSSWLSCKGFTYHSSNTNFSVASRVYFKSSTLLNMDGSWSSYIRDGGLSDAAAMAQLLADTGADGFNGDTMGWVPEQFYTLSKAKGVAAAIEPEGGGDALSQNWDTMGWGYWSYPLAPAVDKWKWIDPRHHTDVCDRWNKNKTNNLQAAFFNGDGYVSWENVW